MRRRILLLITLLLVAVALSLLLGRYPSPGLMSLSTIEADPVAKALVLNLRLPRILTAVLLGMALAGSGTVFQTIFSNPLIEPGFLGVSQGAAFGAAFCILFLTNSGYVVQVFAVVFAFAGLWLSYVLARRVRYGGWVLRLVLAGIAVSAFFSAGVGLLKYAADPLSQLQEITFWMLGGLWNISWPEFLSILPAVGIALWVLYSMRWRLNILSLNDETAHSLGVNPARERTVMLVAATTAAALVISISGLVGWVGLIIPHIARRLFGANTRYSLPGSLVAGGLFTLLCDDIARTLLYGEIPLGIITSMIGAAVFILLMVKPQVAKG